MFSKVGWENETSDIDLSYTYTDNDLIGNGFVPESHLSVDRKAVYTFPDQTENRMHFVNLQASHWLTDSLLAAGNIFYRDFERDTLNGDAELGCGTEIGPNEFAIHTDNDPDEEEDDRVHTANCDSATIAALHPDAVVDHVLRVPFDPNIHEAELEVEGEERTTYTQTDNYGGTLQFSHNSQIASRENTLIFGAAYDKSKTRFSVSESEAELFQEGVAFGTEDPEPAETDVDINTEKENWAIYFTDTIDLSDRLAFTVSGRYQHTTVDILDLTGDPENQDLNGNHKFSRFNPAAGLNFRASDSLTLYGSYNESFRAPTAAELTCADPEDPCNLPNSFVADPPLDPVIGKTYELGARGRIAGISWSAALFRTNLEDDLLFTTISSAGAGFFQNVEETRRQGFELGLNGLHGRFAWYTHYSLIDATFESDERLASVVDPDGLYVKAGDQLPAIPKHNVKLGFDFAVTDDFHFTTTATYASSTFMRGDESNQLPKVDDYFVVNMGARFETTENVQLWLKVDNVFDTEYVTSGIRNFNGFPVDGGEIEEERFVSPGAPRSAWIGLKVKF